MIDLRKIFGHKIRGTIMYALSFLPDATYVNLFYFAANGKTLNLKNPVTFCEKLNWLKIHDRHPEHSDYVDKLKVRDIVKEKLGEDISIPLLGHWQHFDDIDFDALPNQFVIKCNHDSGSTKIIKDKSSLSEKDFKEMRKFYEKRLKQNFYYAGREYPYKNVVPCILIEELMVDEKNPETSIEDYKFMCFDGKAEMMFIVTDRSTDCRIDYFDRDFNHLDMWNTHINSDKVVNKPDKFDEMWDVAEKLTQGIKFTRLDLYVINGKIYFGEYTFFEGGGFRPYHPDEVNYKLGDMIHLD